MIVSSKRSKEVIIILGPPGAGKGTQAELLSDKFKLYLFETSEVLEDSFSLARPDEFIEIGEARYYYLEEKKKWEAGELCDPEFVSELVKREMKRLAEEKKNLVIAGSPRTLTETKMVIPFLSDLYGKSNIKMLLIDIPAQETIFRNSHRRICRLTRHPILYNKETKDLKICPLDGSPLVKRKWLDDPETILVRLNEYRSRTLPLLRYCRKDGFKIKEINGVGSVEKVFQRVLKALGKND